MNKTPQVKKATAAKKAKNRKLDSARKEIIKKLFKDFLEFFFTDGGQGTNNEKKFEVTKELIRQCYKNGYTRDVTHIIMKFFDRVIRLPEAYENRIKEVIDKAEEEYKMEYIPLWERGAHKKGIREGIKRGIERGIECGIGQGKRETAIKMLSKGYDIAVVCEITGLAKEEVVKLAETEVTTH